MLVPFFTPDDEMVTMAKLRILSLIRALRNVDILLIILGLFPMAINAIYYFLVKGLSNPFLVFNSLYSMGSGETIYSISGWFTNGYGLSQFIILLSLGVARAWFSHMIRSRMLDFEARSQDFRWRSLSKIKLMLFLPFFSFPVYRVIHQLSTLEVIHQYNL